MNSGDTARLESSNAIHSGILKTLTGELHDQPEAGSHERLFLQTDGGKLWPLALPRRLADNFDAHSASGLQVKVRFNHGADPGSHLQLVEAPVIVPEAGSRRRLLQTGSAPIGSVRMLVMIMDLQSQCGTAPPATSPSVSV